MKLHFLSTPTALALVLIISACGSSSTPTAPPVSSPVSATGFPTEIALEPTAESQAQALPTSRGPELEAIDPSTVQLAAGQLQLVEFFRFT